MLVVVGGHSRNIGKTAVACSIIRALPEWNWTAIKITQYPPGVCVRNGEACPCDEPTHVLAMTEELFPAEAEPGRLPPDSARFLLAGAKRAWWVRTRATHLAEAMPRLREVMDAAENVIIESNSILEFVQPDFCAMVLDGAVRDFKASCARFLERADALVVTSGGRFGWREVPEALLSGKPRFPAPAPGYSSEGLIGALKSRVGSADHSAK